MTIEEINNTACQIIAFAGDSKSCSMAAIEAAENKNFDEAKSLLEEADKGIHEAHLIHTSLLVKEAQDPGCVTGTMMLIHASNHLSVAEITRELAEKFVNVYKSR